jgi:uncharacterized protein YdeI (YjbR/CyaY-like superfamily)
MMEFSDVEAWDAWLVEHPGETEAWLRIGKRNAGAGLIGIGDAGDVALCHGWIDGHRKGLDDVSFLQRYSRRRPRSSWSQVNVARAERLTAAGRMRPGGFAEVAAAQADGRWAAAYEPQRTADVPPDLAAALAADAAAGSAFAALNRTARYAVILPLLKARTPQARARLLARAVADLAPN